MTYTDMVLRCRDCGADFTFTAGEQEFFASKGYTNNPSRCPDCRRASRGQRDGGSSFGSRSPRQLYAAVCAECGADTQVPFEPRQDKPVYCRPCYDKRQGR